jgi:hypothetical protein
MEFRPLEPRYHINSPISFGPDGLTMDLIGQTYSAAFGATGLFMSGSPVSSQTVGTIDYNASTLTDPITSTDYGDTSFLVHYSGQMVVDSGQGGTYHFQLPNADGAILVIDGTPVIYALSLAGDTNLDGKVDFFDISQELGAYYNAGGTHTWTDGDVTGDGPVDFFDLAETYAYYYDTSTTVTAGVVNANTNYMVDDGWLADGISLSAGSHSFDLWYYQNSDTGSPYASLQYLKGSSGSYATMTGAPAIVDGPTIATTAGPAVYGTIATFAASADSTSASDYTADLDWGDGSSHAYNTGTSPALTIHDLGNGRFSITGSHSYSTGSYTPSLSVTYNPTGDTATKSGTATIAASGPGADWQLNQTSGMSVPDSSGYEMDGSLDDSAAPVWSGAADRAPGLYFDGSGQRMIVPDGLNLDPISQISVGAYVNAASWSSGRRILQKSDGTTTQYALWDDSGNLKFSVAGLSPGYVTASLPSTGAWHAIVGTYDGSYLKIYIDGTQAASTSASGSPTATTGDLNIGYVPASTTSGNSFNGTITEAKVYDYAVGSSDIPSVFPPPSFSTAAAASSSTISGTTVNLTATGSSPIVDASDLTYTWVASSKPTGAPDPSLTYNGNNWGSNTTATFFQAGSYTLACQLSDGTLVNTETVSVTVNPTLTSIVTTPDAFTVAASDTYHVAATALDQFGQPLATQPSFSWSASAGSYSSGVYTAPSSGAGPYTLSASATSGGQSATHTASITIGGGSSPGSVPSAVTGLISSVGDGADVQLAWSDGSGGGTLGGFRVEASMDSGTTYTPLGFVAAGDTMFMATGLTADSPYVFRVTPYNAAGSGTPTTASIDSTSSSSEDGQGWYKVSFQGTPTTQSFTLGSGAHSGDSGSLSLTSAVISAGGWIQAGSAADALEKAFTGSFSSGYDSSTFTFGSSGAFRYVPDYVDADGNDLGPAVAVEDEFNASCHGAAAYDSAYALVNATLDETDALALSDQTLYSVPSAHTSFGTFYSSDDDASTGDFTATITFDATHSVTGTISSISAGYFGVHLANSAIPTGVDATSYTLTVDHGSRTSGSDGGGAKALDRPASAGALPIDVPSATDDDPPDPAVFLQPSSTFMQWKKRKVNTIIFSFTDTFAGLQGLSLDDATIERVADWVAAAKKLNLKYILPVENVEALNAGLNSTNTDTRNYVKRALKVSNEWSDPDLSAVSVSRDEPNSGDNSPDDSHEYQPAAGMDVSHINPVTGSYDTSVTVPSVAADIQNIHGTKVLSDGTIQKHPKKKAYVNLAGIPFKFAGVHNWNTDPAYTQHADILSMDYYPVNNPYTDYADGLNDLAQILQTLHGAKTGNPGASLEAVLECSDQGELVSTSAAPTAAQMAQEFHYARVVANSSTYGHSGVKGICWFPLNEHAVTTGGTTVHILSPDYTTTDEANEVKYLDEKLLGG